MSNRLCRPSTAVGETAWLRGDDRVPDGTHWRISIRDDSLPAGPVVVFDSTVRPIRVEEAGMGPGYVVPGHPTDAPYPVEHDRPLDILVINDRPDDWVIAWAQVDAGGDLRVAVIDPAPAPNGEYAELAARTEPPYSLAVADLRHIRVTGSGAVDRVELYCVPRSTTEGLGDVVDVASIAEDVAEELSSSYVRAPGTEEPWESRVSRSAPMMGLPYDPRGPDRVPYHDGDEVDRISTLVHEPGSVADWLRRAYRSLFDPRALRWAVTGEPPEPGVPAAQVTYNAVDALCTACVDPGVARWLGRSGTLQVDVEPEDARAGWLYVAVLPVYLRRPVRPPGGTLLERYESGSDGAFGRATAIASSIQPPFGLPPWSVSLLIVPLAVATASPALPPVPRVSAVPAAWHPRAVDGGPDTWTQTLRLGPVVPTGSVSLVTPAPRWRSLHDVVGGGQGREGEAARLIAGWPKDTGEPVVSTTRMTEGDVPGPTVSFAVRLGDWVGRWGEQGGLTAAPPERPAPPPPQLSGDLRRVSPPPVGTGPASPGTVKVRVRVPPTPAPGSLPVATVTVTATTGWSRSFALDPDEGREGTVRTAEIPAPPTQPGEQRMVRVTAFSTDTAGHISAEGSCEVHAIDIRPVRGPLVAPRLLVTTRRTNDPTVSITLSVAALPGAAAYRFLTAAESTVRAATPGLDTPHFRTLPRAVRADQLLDAGGGERAHYMWATEEPATVRNGRAQARIDLPSGTSDVVLVKAIPMTGTPHPTALPVESVSTPFADVAAAAVVVPISDVPPIAQLTLKATATGATSVIRADVRATGADRAVLGRLEGAVEARIVEVVTGLPGTLADPVFWPEVARVALIEQEGGFTASAEIEARPWARACLAVMVRYPPEPTTLRGAVVEQPELTATGLQPDPVESPWGPASAPCWVEVPGPEPTVRPGTDDATVAFEVTGLPDLPPGQPTWTATVMAGPSALLAVADHAVATTSATVTAGPRDPANGYAVVLTDPFGHPRAPVRL